MAEAWDATVDYGITDRVTHGGHIYAWSSGDDSLAVEPPAGGWVRVDSDPAPSGATVTTMAVYEDNAVGDSGIPVLVLVDRFPHDADGTAIEINDNEAILNVLIDGTYAISLLGETWHAGTTGGQVTLQLVMSGQGLAVDAEGAPDDAPEFDASVSLTVPLLAGDQIVPSLLARGAVVEGFIRLIVTKIA